MITKLTRSKKYLIARLWGWQCGYCKIKVAFYPSKFNGTEKAHIDHILPESLGGSDCFHNLVLACQTCNLEKSDKDMSNHPLAIEIQEIMSKYCECDKFNNPIVYVLK